MSTTNTQPNTEWPPYALWHMDAAKQLATLAEGEGYQYVSQEGFAEIIARFDPGTHDAATAQDIKRRNYELIDQRNVLVSALIGARKAMRKALPHLHPDDSDYGFVGEWLDGVNEVLDRQGVARE
jgi:hypothetical protein